jgi:CheY-like chemotaxis protein
VLLVDDDEDGRELIAMILEESGAVVTQARSANEALEAFLAEAPDVLISDIGLPVEDGFGLLRRIRAAEATRGGAVTAVALSGFGRIAGSEAPRASGFAAHLTKPVGHVQLLRTLTELLQGTTSRA